MPISTPHPDHSAMAPFWAQVRDCVTGSARVKAAGYLPCPTGLSKFDGTYAAYSKRALYYGAPGRTVEALAGLLFQKAPVVVVPPGSEDYLLDINLAGTTFELLAHHAAREVITTGRHGLLVDVATEGEVRPYMVAIHAENITGWRVERLGGDEVLTRLVLKEFIDEDDPADPYTVKSVERYSELALVDGVYKVRVWSRSDPALVVSTSMTPWSAGDWLTPMRRGKALDFIPFVFLGPASLTADVVAPPILALTDIALSWFFTSADLEWGQHYVGTPTYWASGLAGDDKAAALHVGSSTAWLLSENGRAGVIEVGGQGFAALRESLEMKARLMATLGARLLEGQPKGSETATAVGMRHSGEHANLRTIAQVLEQGLTAALKMLVWWAAVDEKVAHVNAGVEINKDFFAVKASPDEIKTLFLLWQGGGCTFDTLYEGLQKGGWSREGITAKEEKAAIDRAEENIRLLPPPGADDEDDDAVH